LGQAELNDIELMYEGIWWPAADEGISVKKHVSGSESSRRRAALGRGGMIRGVGRNKKA
jgi:hypothetical protein